MEERIVKIETEIALMAQSLKSIDETLSKMSEIQTSTKILESKLSFLDMNLKESFGRVHKRIDSVEEAIEKESNARGWVVKTVIGSVLLAVMSIVLKGNV